MEMQPSAEHASCGMQQHAVAPGRGHTCPAGPTETTRHHTAPRGVRCRSSLPSRDLRGCSRPQGSRGASPRRRPAYHQSQPRTFGLTAPLLKETEEGSIVLLRAIAFTSLPHQACTHPASGLMISRSARSGCTMASVPPAPCPSRSPELPLALPQRKHCASCREQLWFPHLDPLCCSLPKTVPIARRLNGNIRALSLRPPHPRPLRRQRTSPHASWGTAAPWWDPTVGSETKQPPAGAVCLRGPFTTVKQLEESQTMKEYGKKLHKSS